MRLCFILEEAYQDDEMPRAVAECVRALGHTADLLKPYSSVTNLSELGAQGALEYDAYILKTAPRGPGLSILEAAGAAGIPTINPWRSIRLVRDKAVAVALARVNGLRMPRTLFVSTPSLLNQVGSQDYPLVIKPSQGSASRAVHRVEDPGKLRELTLSEDHLLVQPYVANEGFDVKVYNTGREIFAVQCPSPLHPELTLAPRLLTVTPELRKIALRFGRVFGLRIYGIDLLPTPDGWVAVDVNDFPSFREVPDAAERVAATVLHAVTSRPRPTSNGRRSRSRAFAGPDHSGRPDPADVAPQTEAQLSTTTRSSGTSRDRGLTVGLITDRPKHPVLTVVAAQLGRRYRVRLLDTRDPPAAGLAVERELEAPADVYLLRSHTPATIALARRLKEAGAVVVNHPSATATCVDRVELSAQAQAAGLPWPETHGDSELEPSGDDSGTGRSLRYPVVVKSRWSRRGDVVQRVDSHMQLTEVGTTWPGEPLILQSYIPNDGADRKLYVVDGRVFGLHCPSRLSGGDPDQRVPIVVPLEWERLAQQVGRAFNLQVYGVDLVLSTEGPLIVDINPFPGFRGVPGAAEALVTMVDRLAAQLRLTA